MFTQIFNNFSNSFGKPLCYKHRPQVLWVGKVCGEKDKERKKAQDGHIGQNEAPGSGHGTKFERVGGFGRCLTTFILNRHCAF